MVSSREPLDELYRELADEIDIARVGDCSAPSTIAAAVFAGHRYAQEMDEEPDRDNPTRMERPAISS
jgi:dimethylamine/trimethylamine dehydrogenase